MWTIEQCKISTYKVLKLKLHAFIKLLFELSGCSTYQLMPLKYLLGFGSATFIAQMNMQFVKNISRFSIYQSLQFTNIFKCIFFLLSLNTQVFKFCRIERGCNLFPIETQRRICMFKFIFCGMNRLRSFVVEHFTFYWQIRIK